jgi:hypothetical protein
MVVSNTAVKLSRLKNHSQANVAFTEEPHIQPASSAGVGELVDPYSPRGARDCLFNLFGSTTI